MIGSAAIAVILATMSMTVPHNDTYEIAASELGRNPVRAKTDFIILHTTEGEFDGSMARLRRHGLVQYVVDRDGTSYVVVPRDRFANHAGKSLWNGERDISRASVGIEIVGYHFDPVTAAQYATLKRLVAELRITYRIPEENVLGHYQVAANTNRWSPKLPLRGRRSDGSNIDWKRVGIRHNAKDVDFESGRVGYDDAFRDLLARLGSLEKSDMPKGRDPSEIVVDVYGDEVIRNGITAWTIAGDDYDASDTFYLFPNGFVCAGSQFSKGMWDKVPAGTRVFMHATFEQASALAHPVSTLKAGETVWSKVRTAYKSMSTCYVTPDGEIIRGNAYRPVPVGTRIILGCGTVKEIGRDGVWKVAGKKYNTPEAIYLFPNGDVQRGDDVKDFHALAIGTRVILRQAT